MGVLGQLMMSRATTLILVMFSLGPNYEPTTMPSRLHEAGGVTQILGDLVSKTRGCACQPLEDDGVAAHSTHPPTYRWEPDGVVDLLGTTAPPHTTRFAA